MLVRRPDGPWTAPPGLTFRDWIRHGRAAVPDRPPPTPDDLGYHLSTLFPPVRARGHLEVRYLDAQPDGWWPVPVAVVSALVDDVTVAQEALAGCAAVRGRWQDAAHRGMRDRELARAAGEVLLAAAGSLARHPDTAPVARIVHAYLEHWTLRGRSPADDLLDGVRPPVAPTVRRLQGVLS
jgi:glutamate--cysteine ligase